jgi:hypothetical protein
VIASSMTAAIASGRDEPRPGRAYVRATRAATPSVNEPYGPSSVGSEALAVVPKCVATGPGSTSTTSTPKGRTS